MLTKILTRRAEIRKSELSTLTMQMVITEIESDTEPREIAHRLTIGEEIKAIPSKIRPYRGEEPATHYLDGTLIIDLNAGTVKCRV